MLKMMLKMMCKRMIAMALVCSMLLSCIGVVSAETTNDGVVTSGTKITETTQAITAGDYYMDGDVTLNVGLTISGSGTINLYLNDCVLTGSGSYPVIRINNTGATLNIYDVSSGTEKSYDDPTDTASNDDDKLTLSGGAITGGVGDSQYGGGGIMIYSGTVNLYGGNVVGNATKVEETYGGGVHVEKNGYFNLYGGSVSGNTSHAHGGGIYVQSGGYCTIDGGTVSYNYNSSTYGGGVYGAGTVTMLDGTISNNRTALGGGGLSIVGNFNMSGGTISGNVSGGAGGGVQLGWLGVLNMSGGTISGNTAGGNSGGVVISQANAALHMSGTATITNNTANGNGGGVTYTTGTMTVADEASVTGNYIGSVETGYEANVYVGTGKTIGVTDDFDGAVGVTYASKVGQVAVGSDYDITISDKDNFTSDEDYYVITRNNDVQLVEAVAEDGNDVAGIEYSASAIDLATLTDGDGKMFPFTFEGKTYGNFALSDFTTATTTYTITGGTGYGSITGSELTVDKVGTFEIEVTTELCHYAPPSTQTATLTVTPKTITVSGLSGVERRYDSTDLTVDITGGSFEEGDVIPGDDVSIDYTKAVGTIDDSDYASFDSSSDTTADFDIDITGLALTGADKDNYILQVTEPVSGTVKINQSVPYISWPAANDVYIGTATNDDQLLGGKVMVNTTGTTWITVDGEFEFVEGGDNENAGTHGYQVQFVISDKTGLDDDAIADIESATRTVYQIVEPAEVKFEVDEDGDVTATVLNGSAEITDDDYAVTYTVWSSYPEITLVSVAFNSDNFRHAGTLESTGKQVGAYYNDDATDEQKLTYTVQFFGDSSNEYTTLKETGVVPQDILILPGYTDSTDGEVIAWTTKWAGVTTTYEVCTRFPQPSHDVEFVAVYAPSEYTVSGTVTGTDLDGTEYSSSGGLSDIGVTLMQGDTVIGTAVTDSSGDYKFENVPEGNYNIVFTRDYGTRQEVTKFVVVDDNEDFDLTFPSSSTDNSVLYISEGMGAITVENYNDAVTGAASDLTITSVDTSTANDMIDKTNTLETGKTVTSSNMKLFYDISDRSHGD